MSRAIKILSFQNFYEVLKTCSAGRKDFFDTLRAAEIKSLRLFMEINVCFSSENQAALGIISAVGITFMQKLARNSATL